MLLLLLLFLLFAAAADVVVVFAFHTKVNFMKAGGRGGRAALQSLSCRCCMILLQEERKECLLSVLMSHAFIVTHRLPQKGTPKT